MAITNFSMIIKKLLIYSNNLSTILRPHVEIILFILFLLVYLVTEMNNISSRNLSDYPFGADVPNYTFGIGNLWHHPLTGWLITSYRYFINNLLHIAYSTTVAKFLFSFFGAINVMIVYRIFLMFFNRYKSFLFTVCYGFSLSVWYFSSVPESYVISATLYSLYFWYFIKHCSDLRLMKVLILLGILAFAICNDISSVFLLFLPLIYFNKEIITNKRIRSYFLLHVFFLVALCIMFKFLGWDVVKFFLIQREGYGPSSYVLSDFIEPFLNVIFFSVGAPSHETSYAPRLLSFNSAFFKPTLLGYMDHIVTAIFFIFYGSLMIIALSRVQLIKHNKFIIPFIVFIAARYLSIVFFNPGEAFLFTTLSTLPLLLILFCLFDTAHFRYKGAFELVLFLSMFASNLRFLIQ